MVYHSRAGSISNSKHNITDSYISNSIRKNLALVRKVTDIIDYLIESLTTKDTSKLLPSLLITKLQYALTYYQKILIESSRPVQLPKELIDDKEMLAISKCTDIL
jgi:hypothetical protein